MMYLTQEQKEHIWAKPEDAISLLADIVNGNHKYKEMAQGILKEHRTLQASIITLMLTTIYEMSLSQDTDLRNEYAVERCKQIVENMNERHGEAGVKGVPWWTQVENC